MNENNLITVPLSYEYFFSHLFGKANYHGHVGALNITAWKKDLRKLVKYIRKSIVINAHTDQLHKDRILQLCDSLDNDIKNASSINEASVSVIQKYTKLIFLLLGNSPDHWNRKAPYHDRFWKLNGHRTLTYTQTDEQKSLMGRLMRFYLL